MNTMCKLKKSYGQIPSEREIQKKIKKINPTIKFSENLFVKLIIFNKKKK